MLFIKKIAIVLAACGFYPLRFFQSICGVPVYVKNLLTAMFLNKNGWKFSLFPIFSDRYDQSGVATGHYFNMDLWAARKVFSLSPAKLVDVGSRVDGFVAHILSFREIEVFDVRPLQSNTLGLTFQCVDMADPDFSRSNYADVVSCLHALEHFGLGRYGDQLDMNGWKLGLKNLSILLLPGGTLLLAVPVGHERIEFDAHRVFDPETIVHAAEQNNMKLLEYSVVDDSGMFHEGISVVESKVYEYGCGCFHFKKLD